MTTDNADELACRELVELITDYLEGVLPAADQQRFTAHLQVCPGCRKYVEQMRLTIRAIGRATPEPLPPETRQRLLETFREWISSR